MLEVFYHKKFEEEKRYVFDVFFNDILGVEYAINFHEIDEYKICFNNKEIVIKDSFFSEMSDLELYYKDSKNIPSNITKVKTEYSPESDMICLYGDADVAISNQRSYVGGDLIASAFFMLTRWEEIAIHDKDKHGRFIEKNSLSIKHRFHKRPIVNEYVEFLWNVLLEMGYSGKRKEKLFKFYPTHDVDFFLKYDGFFKFCKTLGGDLFKRRNLSDFFSNLKGIFNVKIRNGKDVYDTFDFLMDISELKSVKSRFYFMTGTKGERGVTFDINDTRVKVKIQHILNRGHIIGIHPTYNSFTNVKILKEELELLNNIYPEIEEGRQHFLRFSNPITWQIWNDCNLNVDSTIGFYDTIGFRAGICNEYTLFNVISKKKLNLRERPLLLMDTALRKRYDDKEMFIEKSKALINIVKKYNGDFVMLWHNNNLMVNEWEGWNKVYAEIVKSV